MFRDHKVAYLRDHVKVRNVERFSFLRESMAYMMELSARRIPHAAMNSELDVTPLVEYTSGKEKELAKSEPTMSKELLFKRAIHKNFSSFFLKAIAHAVHHTPCMNAFLDYGVLRGGTLYHADDVNLGVTVHTKYGVVRPVLRNPHLKPLTQVAAEMRDLARRARRTDPEELFRGAAKAYLKPALKECDLTSIPATLMMLRSLLFSTWKPDPEYLKIKPEEKLQTWEILGATVSVANIGMMVPGCQTVTVIPTPEVMMFGLGNLHVAPKVINGEIVPRYVMTVCASMDHRAYDAGEAFPFGEWINKYISHPELIYEWEEGDEI